MNFKRLFVFVIFAVLVLTAQTEAGKLKKLGKKIEKAGKNVVHAVDKVIPTVLGLQQIRENENNKDKN
ncbi:AAEL000775-PA [Aedes aegypti]|uniref:AAEL000775-PA n=1 Tax=Aedes aegypti TaxID=7159 RepID=Q17N75_AEDAE|nr:AAEL000775-PA [Aedes aegypti]